MVMSEESIWEDTLGPNIEEILAEITNEKNYAQENTTTEDGANKIF